jgi:hypothetical protein
MRQLIVPQLNDLHLKLNEWNNSHLISK